MKTFKILSPLLLLLFLCPYLSAQQAFWVHEDPVYPAKAADYEAYCSTLAVNSKKYDIKKANWFTISTDDLRYFHISPIEKMADLDQSRFSVLQDKMGEQEFNQLFENFDNCYDSHYDYIIHLDNDLSYMPEGVDPSGSGSAFVKLEFFYATPQNFEKLLELAQSFKDLYAKKNSKEYYRVFRSGFGSQGQFIIVAISAKNAAEYEKIRVENKELLGEDRDKIYDELLKNISKVETLNGYMREDLSYEPQ